MNEQFGESTVMVVGGGLAGLSAAAYLARAGVAVTLFEKAAALGGRAATQHYDEYRFNRGAHALYYGGPATQVLQELGVPYSGHIPPVPFMLARGKIHSLPSTPGTLLRNTLLDTGDKLELVRVLARLVMGHPAALGRQSIAGWLDRTVRRPRVRRVLDALARTFTYTAALDQVSADVFATQMKLSAQHNVRYLDGGWQTLVDGVRRVAQQAGARIVSGTRVDAVTYQDGQVQAVRLGDGTAVTASAVILAVPPQDAARLIDAGAYAPLRRLIEPAIAVHNACLDVALSRIPVPHNSVIFDLDRPRFQTAQSLIARVAPPGGGLIHTIKYLDPAQPGDPRADEQDLEALLDRLQPGWRDVLVKRNVLPRIESVSWLPTAATGGMAGRPGPTVPGIAGLYLAGDWIGSEGYLVDAVMASARQAARLVQQEHGPVRAAVPVAADTRALVIK